MRYVREIFKFILIFIVLSMAISWWRTMDSPSGLVPDVSFVNYLNGSTISMRPESSNTQNHVFYFFAPWCGVCQKTANGSYIAINKHQGVKASFIAVDFDSKLEVKEFVDRYLPDVDRSNIFFGDDSVKSAWALKAYPTYAFVSRDRDVASMSVGYVFPFIIWFKLKWMTLGQAKPSDEGTS